MTNLCLDGYISGPILTLGAHCRPIMTHFKAERSLQAKKSYTFLKVPSFSSVAPCHQLFAHETLAIGYLLAKGQRAWGFGPQRPTRPIDVAARPLPLDTSMLAE